MVVLRPDLATPEAFDLDLDGVFDASPEDALAYATVRGDTRVPPLASADDSEPPSPEDLGAYWLARATDSERSRDESDLELDVDGLADPGDTADSDPRDEDEDEDDAVIDTRAV